MKGFTTYLSVFNKQLNRKKSINFPPHLENGIFLENIQTKAKILNMEKS